MDIITYQQRVDVLGSASMVTSAKNSAALAAKASPEHVAPARTSFESSIEESSKGCKSHQTRHRSCSRSRRNRTQKASNLVSTVSMSDTFSSRKARRIRCVESLNLSEFDSDHSSQKARCETYKENKALKVIHHVNDRYKEALEFCTHCLTNTSNW